MSEKSSSSENTDIDEEVDDIIVIDEVNDDLEEGEITDGEPEVKILKYPKTKPKKLPRRYNLHNRSSNKHRNCKHKTKNKLKNSTYSFATPLKKHKSSCHRHNLEKHRLPVERLNSAKSEFNLYDLKYKENQTTYVSSSQVKSAFKNYTSPPRAASKSEKIAPNNYPNHENEDNFSRLLLNYKKAKERFNQKTEKVDSNCQNNSSKRDNTTQNTNDKKEHISPTRAHFHGKTRLNSIEKKNESESEDDDVDELRRIALATFAKKLKAEKESLENIDEVASFDSNDVSNSPSEIPSQKPSESFHAENDNGSRDNYDVVDMDIDDDENLENLSNSNLFIIDKTPASSEFSQKFPAIEHNQDCNVNVCDATQDISPKNGTEPLSNTQFKSNEDFEEELLRAELIASLNSTQRELPSPPCNIPLKGKLEVSNKILNSVQKTNVAKPHNVYPKGPVRNLVKRSSKAIIQGKPKFSKLTSKTIKPPPPRSINAAQKRLIITLNNDTTTEESEEESDKNIATQENVPVSSIEALISSARQKSDVNQSKISNSNDVSCLSKAQQEEYNNLKKILAEKEPYSVPPPIVKEKIVPDQTHLNFLIDKISVAKDTLEKELGKKNQLQTELLKKKQNYMASKLKVQLLKEQLHAAEKLRAANLESWKQSSAKLDVFKKSVSKWKNLIQLLETELSSRCSHS
ncbi:uncharacterized protein TNCT_356061 [Trichonephila clavata]|uniref:Uncharacterized protein n=1 Tax=Trichonephila clavata TaxID=2740835 RepID=A0A8X6FLF3_TRICU|nr:uncharacterized protein TNCT_356061 [Trichonephila clavata]